MEEEALYQMAVIEHRCPRCQGRTRLVDKQTFTGRDLREYGCTACDWTHLFDLGDAMCKIMSDANRDSSAP
jgi:rubredoxin